MSDHARYFVIVFGACFRRAMLTLDGLTPCFDAMMLVGSDQSISAHLTRFERRTISSAL